MYKWAVYLKNVAEQPKALRVDGSMKKRNMKKQKGKNLP